MSESFHKAVEEVKCLKKKPNTGDMTVLYGLYKQATVGDINIARPGLLDLTGQLKWDAWNINKVLSKEEAMETYVQVVDKLKSKE